MDTCKPSWNQCIDWSNDDPGCHQFGAWRHLRSLHIYIYNIYIYKKTAVLIEMGGRTSTCQLVGCSPQRFSCNPFLAHCSDASVLEPAAFGWNISAMELPLAPAAPAIPASHQKAISRQPGRAARSSLSPRGAASLSPEAKGSVSKLERHESNGKKDRLCYKLLESHGSVLFLQIQKDHPQGSVHVLPRFWKHKRSCIIDE